MNLQPENSAACFKRLLQESNSQKFHTSLERIKKACDGIEDMKGLLNYSRVAKYTENHYGSPKRQSIMNSKRLRLYIDLRKQEYGNKSPAPKRKKAKNITPRYPTSDLDLKTKVFIDQLHSLNEQLHARNAFLEKAMRNLQQEILHTTRENPIDVRAMIEKGAQEDLSMKIVREQQDKIPQGISTKAKTAIEKLLALADNPHCSLKVEIIEGERNLMLKSAMAPETILFADELVELETLLA